jgi:hypothetical protein
MSKKALLLLIVFTLFTSVFAQENKDLQETFLEAEFFLMNEDYSDALTYYLQLYEKLPENENLAYCIGSRNSQSRGRQSLLMPSRR